MSVTVPANHNLQVLPFKLISIQELTLTKEFEAKSLFEIIEIYVKEESELDFC